jgi:glycosyltransferase involved in cell wall biosynthesis
MTDLTVFVGTFNRTDTLTRCIEYLQAQRRPVKVVVVDNGSRDRQAKTLLDELAAAHTVYRMPAIEDYAAAEGDDEAHGGATMQAVARNYQEAMRLEWENEPRPAWYAVCDADTWLDGHPDSLDVYVRLARSLNRAVGPHLRLNVGRNYPLRSAALILNARILFRDHMQTSDGVPWSPDDIDSTFHLFPAAPVFRRLKMDTARVGPPYDATHSDWLLDFHNLTHENHAYIRGCGEAASWGGRWLKGFFYAWLESPREAYLQLEDTQRWQDDYFYEGFMLSWMLQHGHGCDIDLDRSWETLCASFPAWSPCWAYRDCWDDLVYNDDHSCLGW